MKAKTQVESMSSIILGGNMYELSNDPSHGVIRAIKKMQKDVSVTLIKKHRDKFSDKTPLAEAMIEISKEDPEGYGDFNEATEEFIIVGTISLATNKAWTFDTIGACSDKEVKIAFEKCKEVLGGDVTTFL